ncbi:hypothetical protein Tco_1231575 [Tanacetum coccineum]
MLPGLVHIIGSNSKNSPDYLITSKLIDEFDDLFLSGSCNESIVERILLKNLQAHLVDFIWPSLLQFKLLGLTTQTAKVGYQTTDVDQGQTARVGYQTADVDQGQTTRFEYQTATVDQGQTASLGCQTADVDQG